MIQRLILLATVLVGIPLAIMMAKYLFLALIDALPGRGNEIEQARETVRKVHSLPLARATVLASEVIGQLVATTPRSSPQNPIEERLPPMVRALFSRFESLTFSDGCGQIGVS